MPTPLSWKMCPPQTWILTELALLGLGQGLPAPGPLREGETDTMKAVIRTLHPAWSQQGQRGS